MTRRIFLVRHGRPTLPDDGKYFVGRIDPPLAPEGVLQAEKLRAAMEGISFHRAFTSPLCRAAETATVLLRGRGLEAVELPFLREIDLGEWDGRSFEDVRAVDPEGFAARGRDLAHFRPPGGESFGDLASRVVPPFFELLTRESGDLLLVAHAGVFRAILCSILSLPLQGMFLFGQAHCGVHILEERDGTPRVKRLNWTPTIL